MDLSSLSHSEKIEIILLQAEQINLLKESVERLKAKIKMFEEQKHKNSSKSSKPPFSCVRDPTKILMVDLDIMDIA